jgi:hypothetical protein
VSLAAVLDALEAAGVDAATVIKAVRAHEDRRQADDAEKRAKAAAKKRRQRAEDEAKRAAVSPDVAGTNGDKAGHAGTAGDGGGQSGTKDAAAPVHTRGENNLSRLEVTGFVGGVGETREPDQQTDDWPKGDAVQHVKLLVAHVASPWLDPQKSPDLITTRARLAAWKRDGASWVHDVLPTIEGLCANRRSAVSSWKFFDAAMGRAIAENRRALEIPEAVPRQAGRDPPRRQSLADQIGDEQRRAREMTLKALSAANG